MRDSVQGRWASVVVAGALWLAGYHRGVKRATAPGFMASQFPLSALEGGREKGRWVSNFSVQKTWLRNLRKAGRGAPLPWNPNWVSGREGLWKRPGLLSHLLGQGDLEEGRDCESWGERSGGSAGWRGDGI